MPLDLVRSMINQVHGADRMFKQMLASMFPGGVPSGPPRPSAGGQPGPSAPPPAQQGPMPGMQQPRAPHPPHPPTVQPIPSVPAQPASSPAAPPAHTPSATSPPFVTGTPILKKPTPKPTAETPSAATPTHVVNSPQTPKSPRTKPKPKPVAKPRKPSTKVTPVANAASPSAGPSEIKPPATPAATPANAPTPDSVGSHKRPREDDVAVLSAAAAAPAAKKIKTEWDEPPSDAMTKRQQEADAVKTDDDAMKFFEQMTSWLNQVTNNEGESGESLKAEIADSLDEVLKAYPSIPDDSGLTSLASSSFIDAITVGSSSPRLNASSVDPADFFDFTSYGLSTLR